MKKKILLAGASGAVGQRLSRLLVADGWPVVGTTRSEEKAALLRSIGIEPVVVDVFDVASLNHVFAEFRPTIVIHQLTDLPPALDPAKMPEALIRNTYLREVGTRNLLRAAMSVGVERVIAQSIAFAYASGPTPYAEDAPLDPSSKGVISLEEQVLSVGGIVLRYGKFYGPGTGFDSPPAGCAVHVDAAADAACRAITQGESGIYNIAEDGGTVQTDKAKRELSWDADFRINE
ncbi:NAD(P)-dependent oxidoreductase [Spirosoma sp. BT702]|uniref:NAD(P)-dependent oxidoreductase n=1 Tax=Spirosoma profusum TaxID=2771354 RepID=A0A926Y4P4_9BACT|nr:NAD(P)-dependent oxidoreductase [Spirosoma profusum]MBD2703490.1 NAD(P)-dependent oxidoreductase [Spirosoma profusum]